MNEKAVNSKVKNLFRWIVVCLMLLGYVFTPALIYAAPEASNAKISHGKSQLDRLGADYFFDSVARITSVQYKILQTLPEGEKKDKKPVRALPFLSMNLNSSLHALYHTNSSNGIMVAALMEDYPLSSLEITRGDEIEEVDGMPVNSEKQIKKILEKHTGGDTVSVKFRRGMKSWEEKVPLLVLKKRIPVVLDGKRNGLIASSDMNGILYISPALLEFIENRDELAYLLCRETARIIKGELRFNLLRLKERVFMSSLWEYYFSLPPKGVGTPVYSMGTGRILSSGREEKRLDKVGLEYLKAAGFSGERGMHFFERYAAENPSPTDLFSAAIPNPSPERLLILKQLTAGQSGENSISKEEKKEFESQLTRQQLDLFFDKVHKVMSIGYRLLEAAGKDSPKESLVKGVPLVFTDLNNELRKLYSLNAGVMVVGPMEGYGVETQSRRGDGILAVDGQKVNSENRIYEILKHHPGEYASFRFQNAEKEWDELIKIIYLIRRAPFAVMKDDTHVNAFADAFGGITVTTAMLRFVENDDQLAFVLGHEIAHLTQRHIPRSAPLKVLGSIAGVSLGILVESYAPGFGGLTSQVSSGIITSPYSKKLEIEADHYGLAYIRSAGYSVERGFSIWEKFSSAIPASRNSSIIDTHPASQDRYLKLRQEAGLAETEIPGIVYQKNSEILGPLQESPIDSEGANLERVGLARRAAVVSIRMDRVNAESIFESNVKKIIWFSHFNWKGTNHNLFARKLKVQWIAPNGEIYQERDFKVIPVYEDVAKTALKFKKPLSGNLIGKWRVKVWKENRLIDDRYFLITDQPV